RALATALAGVGVRDGRLRAIYEGVMHALGKGPRLGEEGEQRLLAALDPGREAIEPGDERLAVLEGADVVERGVAAGGEPAHHLERALEVLERGPRVPVVRPEAREVDVAQIEHVVGLDVNDRMPARVSRGVDGAHLHASQIEGRAVAEAERVGARR